MDDAKELVKWRRRMLCVFALGFAAVSASADAVVREYGNPGGDIAGNGEPKVRDVRVFEPAPYVSTSPLAIAFAPKFEFPSEKWDVLGLRLNILVGSHRKVCAIDVGGIGNFADCKMNGIGVAGFFNSVGGSDGAINIAGVFSYAERLNGAQIGIVNFNRTSPVAFLPVANASF